MCVGCVCVHSVTQSCLTLCDLMDCSQPGFSVHGISQGRILEWVAISYSRICLTRVSNPHFLCLLSPACLIYFYLLRSLVYFVCLPCFCITSFFLLSCFLLDFWALFFFLFYYITSSHPTILLVFFTFSPFKQKSNITGSTGYLLQNNEVRLLSQMIYKNTSKWVTE